MVEFTLQLQRLSGLLACILVRAKGSQRDDEQTFKDSIKNFETVLTRGKEDMEVSSFAAEQGSS